MNNRPPVIAQEPRSTLEPAYPTDQVSRAYDISGATTDDQLVSMWLSGRPATTVRAYTADVSRLREHVDKPIRRITAADLIGWTDTLARLKPASQYRVLSAVKSLFGFAHRLGYIDLDPAAALRMPRTMTDRGSKLLSREAVQSLLDSLTGRDRMIATTLYVCGLRESELVALDAPDVRQTASGYALAIRGKGSKLRTIAIPARLGDELRRQVTEGPIFRSVRGNRLSPSDVYRAITAASEAAGRHVTPHMLRHAHASHALDNGAPLHVVRDTLGHASLSTTSVYVHAKPTEGSALYIKPTES